MTPQQAFQWFVAYGLKRQKLNFLRPKFLHQRRSPKLAAPSGQDHQQKAGAKSSGRTLLDSWQIRTLGLLLQGKEEGLSLKAARKLADLPHAWEQDGTRALFKRDIGLQWVMPESYFEPPRLCDGAKERQAERERQAEEERQAEAEFLNQTFTPVLQRMKDALEVEHCALFTQDREKSNLLMLRAQAATVPARSTPGLSLSTDDSSDSLVKKVFSEKQPVNFYAQELKDWPVTHLSQRRSILAAPVHSRKGRVIGVLKAENRLVGPASSANPRYPPFRPQDEILFGAFLGEVEAIIEACNLSLGFGKLIGAIAKMGDPVQYGLCEICDDLVQSALRVVEADFGEVTRSQKHPLFEDASRIPVESLRGRAQEEIKDADKGKRAEEQLSADHLYVLAAQPLRNTLRPITEPELEESIQGSQGSRDPAVLKKIRIPEPSVTHTVFNSGETRHISNTKPEVPDQRTRDYYECNEPTLSEIAVRMSVDNEPIGVLNLESEHVAEQGGLTRDDVSVVSAFARVASVAGRMTMSRRVLYETLIRDDSKPFRESVSNIIKSIDAFLRTKDRTAPLYDRIITYVADYDYRRIWLADDWGLEDRVHDLVTAEPFWMSFDEQALATEVIKEREALASLYPENDPRVSDKGLNLFGITGSLASIPIRLSDDIQHRPVGVLIAWSSEGTYWKEPEDVLRDLEKCAVLKWIPMHDNTSRP